MDVWVPFSRATTPRLTLLPRAVLTRLDAGLAPARVRRVSYEWLGLTLRGVIVEVAFLLGLF